MVDFKYLTEDDEAEDITGKTEIPAWNKDGWIDWVDDQGNYNKQAYEAGMSTEPACNQEGIRFRFCYVCGKFNFEDFRGADKGPHDYEQVPVEAATCLNGNEAKAVKQCKTCGGYYNGKDDDGNDILEYDDEEGAEDAKTGLEKVDKANYVKYTGKVKSTELEPVKTYLSEENEPDIAKEDENYKNDYDKDGHVWTYIAEIERTKDTDFDCVGTQELWGCLICGEKKIIEKDPAQALFQV
jgi:hypothetical protein